MRAWPYTTHVHDELRHLGRVQQSMDDMPQGKSRGKWAMCKLPVADLSFLLPSGLLVLLLAFPFGFSPRALAFFFSRALGFSDIRDLSKGDNLIEHENIPTVCCE